MPYTPISIVPGRIHSLRSEDPPPLRSFPALKDIKTSTHLKFPPSNLFNTTQKPQHTKMIGIMHFFASILLFVGLAISSPLENRQIIPSGCTNITIPVTTSFSGNVPLPSDLTSLNFLVVVNALLSGVFDGVASGTYDIAATYCPPIGVPAREKTLQILIHG